MTHTLRSMASLSSHTGSSPPQPLPVTNTYVRNGLHHTSIHVHLHVHVAMTVIEKKYMSYLTIVCKSSSLLEAVKDGQM